jgi:tetratricopeptide (TPR) repeat protein
MPMHCRLAAAVILLVTASVSPASAQKIADEQSRRDAMQSYRTGQALFAAEKFEPAAEQFQKAIEKDPLLTLAHYSLGQSFMNLQRYASAIKAYNECIEAFRALHGLSQANRIAVEKQRDDEIRELKDMARRMRQQGAGMEMRALQTEQRVDDLERQKMSIEGPFQPPAEVLLALGSAHFRSGNREAAEFEWKAAVQANSKLGEAHNNLAVIYMQTGRLEEAEQELKLAEKSGFRVNPQFKEDLKERKKKK